MRMTKLCPMLTRMGAICCETERRNSLGLKSAGAGSANVIESDSAAAEENQRERERGQRQRKFKSAIARETILKMNFRNGNAHVDANGESGEARKQAGQNQQATEEFRKGGKVGRPPGQSQALHKLNMVMKPAKNFAVSVGDHHCAECQAHDEQREWLQTVEVAQSTLLERADYRIAPAGKVAERMPDIR
jgi:hypothetical protein